MAYLPVVIGDMHTCRRPLGKLVSSQFYLTWMSGLGGARVVMIIL